MLRIPEKTLENAMIALIGLDMGEGVEEVAEAAFTLLHRERRQRERDARGLPREKATLAEANAAEAAKANAPVGVPHGPPEDLLETRPKGPIPAGYAPIVRDAAVQTDDPVLPPSSTWEELRAGLKRARALDQTANRVRTEAFEALERYAGMTADPHAEGRTTRSPAAREGRRGGQAPRRFRAGLGRGPSPSSGRRGHASGRPSSVGGGPPQRRARGRRPWPSAATATDAAPGAARSRTPTVLLRLPVARS